MTSWPSRSRCVVERLASDRRPDSSSPSTNTVTPTGRSSPWARIAARCAAMPALSSAAPRPYSRPSRSVGSNGLRVPASRGRLRAARRGARRAARSARPRAAGLRAITAGSPPCRDSDLRRRSPRRETARRWLGDRRTSSCPAGSALTDWIRTSASRSRRTPARRRERAPDSGVSPCGHPATISRSQRGAAAADRSDRSPDAADAAGVAASTNDRCLAPGRARSAGRSRRRPAGCHGCGGRLRRTGRRRTEAPGPRRSCRDAASPAPPGSA